MARDYSRRNVDIWGDPDMRGLPFPAQYLYNVLWDHPKLSYCGTVDWRPGKIAQLAQGLTPALVRQFAACLQARYFVVIDEDTEEILLRSWVRFDGLMKQPRLAVSYVSAYAELGSNTLRGVVVDELHKLQEREPDLAGFKDKRVTAILGFPRVSARDLPTPEDPFANGFTYGLPIGLGEGLGQTDPKVSVPPTPSPTPAPISNSNTSSSSVADAPSDEESKELREDVERLCQHLADRIEENGSKRPTVNASWRRQCRLLLDRDGRTEEQVRAAIDWCQNDSFWMSNVMSMPKLREQYDQLRLKAQEQSKPHLRAVAGDSRKRDALGFLVE